MSNTLSRCERRDQAQTFIANLQHKSYPNSNRIYLENAQGNVQVEMREIALSDSVVGGDKDHPVFALFDCFARS